MPNNGSARKVGFLDVLQSWSPNKMKLVSGLFFTLFWIITTYAFIIQTLSEALFDKVYSPMLMLADVVILLLGVLTIRNKWDIGMLIAYLVISVGSSIFVNHISVIAWINGSRLYFCMLFLPPFFRWVLEKRERAEYFIHRFDHYLYIFLWIQFPCLLFQMLVFGAGDHGGGSLGNLFSGAISTLIYAISFYLMRRRWNPRKGYFSNLYANWTLVFLLFSTFMNETKISFIYLMMYFLLLIPFDKKFIRSILILSPILVALAAIGGYVYVQTNRDMEGASKTFDLEYLEFYVFGDDQTADIFELALDNGFVDEDSDFMRGAKYAVLPSIIDFKPWGPWIGYGVGQFKGGTVLDTTEFYKRFEWVLHGTTTQVIQMLCDMGVLGILWMLAWIFIQFSWLIGPKASKRNGNMQVYFAVATIMSVTYMNFLSLQTFMLIFLYLIFLSSRWNLVKDTVCLEERVRRRELLSRLREMRRVASTHS